MKNKISDLRNHMFAQLERLSDEKLSPEQMALEISRSKAISDIGKVIVESAKTELLYAKISGHGDEPASGFIESDDANKFNEKRQLERPPAEYSNTGNISVTKKYIKD